MSKKVIKQDSSANHLVVFQENAIRRLWNNEEWWFSVVDVCGVLTDSPDAGAYWRKLKQRLNAEGSEPVTFCHGLKLEAPDGKQRVTITRNRKNAHRWQPAGCWSLPPAHRKSGAPPAKPRWCGIGWCSRWRQRSPCLTSPKGVRSLHC